MVKDNARANSRRFMTAPRAENWLRGDYTMRTIALCERLHIGMTAPRTRCARYDRAGLAAALDVRADCSAAGRSIHTAPSAATKPGSETGTSARSEGAARAGTG